MNLIKSLFARKPDALALIPPTVDFDSEQPFTEAIFEPLRFRLPRGFYKGYMLVSYEEGAKWYVVGGGSSHYRDKFLSYKGYPYEVCERFVWNSNRSETTNGQCANAQKAIELLEAYRWNDYIDSIPPDKSLIL